MNSVFFKNLETYLLTTAELLDSSDYHMVSEIIRSAHWQLEENVYHDNWDGGIDYHNLVLHIPVRLFKDIQEKLTDIEKVILKKINQISRDVTNEGLQNVVILPKLQSNNGSGEQSEKMAVIEKQGELGLKQVYDVFISHLAAYKKEAQCLKWELGYFGVSSFVAHEDIEPTKEWQEEIESALRNTKCLVALLKPGFQESKWCAQEVGFAYARGMKIIPVIQGVDPYGFIGKIHGLKCDSQFLWWEVYKRLPMFKDEYDAFFYAVEKVTSFGKAVSLAKIFQFLPKFSQKEVDRLFDVAVRNNWVRESCAFWFSTRHSMGMFKYLKIWTGVEYELIKENEMYKYIPKESTIK